VEPAERGDRRGGHPAHPLLRLEPGSLSLSRVLFSFPASLTTNDTIRHTRDYVQSKEGLFAFASLDSSLHVGFVPTPLR
jgi:hypothetical protein